LEPPSPGQGHHCKGEGSGEKENRERERERERPNFRTIDCMRITVGCCTSITNGLNILYIMCSLIKNNFFYEVSTIGVRAHN
jgi:hypothetical protein